MDRSIWNVQQSINHLQQKTFGRKSTSDCATFVRLAIKAGGLTLKIRHSAKDYKSSLITAGFLPIGSANGCYLPGDVIIIEPSGKHTDGHMAMYDGKQWLSDFPQKNMLYIYPDQTPEQANMLRHTIFRYGIRWDSVAPPWSSNLA